MSDRRITIRLPEQLGLKLRQQCLEEGTQVSAVIRKALRSYLEGVQEGRPWSITT